MEKNDATECKPLFVCVSPLRVSGHDPPMLFIYGRIYLHDIVEEYKDLLDLADAHDAKRPAKRTVKHTSAIGREVYYVQTAL